MHRLLEKDKYYPDIKNNKPEGFKLTKTDKIRICYSFRSMEYKVQADIIVD